MGSRDTRPARLGARSGDGGMYRSGPGDRRDDRRMGGGVGPGSGAGMGAGVGSNRQMAAPAGGGGGAGGHAGGAGVGVGAGLAAVAEPPEPSEKLKNKVNGFINEFVAIGDKAEALQVRTSVLNGVGAVVALGLGSMGGDFLW